MSGKESWHVMVADAKRRMGDDRNPYKVGDEAILFANAEIERMAGQTDIVVTDMADKRNWEEVSALLNAIMDGELLDEWGNRDEGGLRGPFTDTAAIRINVQRALNIVERILK